MGGIRKSDFTIMVARLILWIDARGWYPLLSFAQRTDEGQAALFEKGLSRCDGFDKISNHQYPKAGGAYAIDIYIHDGDKDIGTRKLYHEAHLFWETLGGVPAIDWDLGHFEVTP